MAHAMNEVFIDRPIQDVFIYVANGENNARWRGGILEVARTSEEIGLGATYRQVISGPNGRSVRHDYRVTTYDPPSRLHFQHMVGLARPAGRIELTTAGQDRTAVRFELSWEPKGFRRIFFDDMIGRWMATEVARLDVLKRQLEEQVGSSA
jgi:uncharacterized protein YndB with AHSA1/START domain